jgi:hypothetical protein
MSDRCPLYPKRRHRSARRQCQFCSAADAKFASTERNFPTASQTTADSPDAHPELSSSNIVASNGPLIEPGVMRCFCCPTPTACQDAKNRAEILIQNQIDIGAPEEIRTPDPQIRSLVLYPAELRARRVVAIGFDTRWQGESRSKARAHLHRGPERQKGLPPG